MASEQHDSAAAGPQRSATDQAKLAGAVTAGLLLLVFLLQNVQQTTIHFLWFDWHMSLILALLLAAIAGAAATWFLTTFRWRRERAEPKT
jgi:uncharacterized integral membrane protein